MGDTCLIQDAAPHFRLGPIREDAQMYQDAALILDGTRSRGWPQDLAYYPFFCIEPNEGESHLIPNATPYFG